MFNLISKVDFFSVGNDVCNIIKNAQIISQLVILFSYFEDAFSNLLKLSENMFIASLSYSWLFYAR